MSDLIAVAEQILETFDVPVQRTHINKKNLYWLLKNLETRNSHNMRFNEVMGLLRKIEKERLYKN